MEIWKTIENYDKYEVSNLGNVRNKKTNRLLKLNKATNGYYQLSLSNNGKSKKFLVNRLVAQAFIPNENNLPQVNHKNKIPTDNRVENLEWCDAQYNIDYSVSKKVCQYKLDGTFIKDWKSARQASRLTDTRLASIVDCCNGKQKTANKYIWKYI